jgi:hypothetical protein
MEEMKRIAVVIVLLQLAGPLQAADEKCKVDERVSLKLFGFGEVYLLGFVPQIGMTWTGIEPVLAPSIFVYFTRL